MRLELHPYSSSPVISSASVQAMEIGAVVDVLNAGYEGGFTDISGFPGSSSRPFNRERVIRKLSERTPLNYGISITGSQLRDTSRSERSADKLVPSLGSEEARFLACVNERISQPRRNARRTLFPQKLTYSSATQPPLPRSRRLFDASLNHDGSPQAG